MVTPGSYNRNKLLISRIEQDKFFLAIINIYIYLTIIDKTRRGFTGVTI